MELLARIRRGSEYVYAIVALFALTQGPVYRLWSESANYQQFIALPTIGQAYFTTFLVLQLPGLLLWFRRITGEIWRLRSFQLLVGLLSWLALSVLWSTFARHSISEFIALIFTTGFGLYLASRFTALEIWGIIAGATSIGLLWSFSAIMLQWDGSVDPVSGYWIGIYFNRNSLAPVAAVAMLGVIGVLFSSSRLHRNARLPIVLVSGAVFVCSFVVLWKAESKTSPLALVISMCACCLWLLLRRLFGKFGSGTSLPTYAAIGAVVIVGSAVFFVLRFVGGLDEVPGETSTFNSRSPLWSLSWSGFLQKPFFGWGWMAAWRTIKFFQQGEWWAIWDTEWSHNGYHDILLGGGVLAGLLFAGMVLVAIRSCDTATNWKESAPRLLVASFVLTAATQESFFIGSHFLWALLITSLFAGELRPTASVDQQHASHRTT